MANSRLKIALVGYGRMGQEIETILVERGHAVAARFDTQAMPGVDTLLSPEKLAGLDGVIEFSLPGAVAANAAVYAQAGVSVVLGTTGWEKDRDTVRALVEKAGTAYLYGSNFSVGVHLFYRLTAKLAALVDGQDQYDIAIHEFHHNKKADSPSGTALSAAEHVLAHCSRKTAIQADALRDRPIRPEELHVSSTRLGSIPGTHTVFADSLADSIEITHTVRSRRGLALGSVLAMEWLQGKRGFMEVSAFMSDVLGPV